MLAKDPNSHDYLELAIQSREYQPDAIWLFDNRAKVRIKVSVEPDKKVITWAFSKQDIYETMRKQIAEEQMSIQQQLENKVNERVNEVKDELKEDIENDLQDQFSN